VAVVEETRGGAVRVESSVTSVSWIPSEAVTGPVLKGTFEAGFTHYDDPPPEIIDDLEAWREAGRFRFANHLAAWAEIAHTARSSMPATRGAGSWARPPSGSRGCGRRSSRSHSRTSGTIRERRATEVRFVQTTGGRTGLPAPRRVNHPPFVQFRAPTVWTTLALTIRADGTSSFEVLGASKFPRHWVFDADGKLDAKVGLADFKDWYRDAFGKHTPWGDHDSQALVTAVETALERQLSSTIMRAGAKPAIRNVKQGKHLVEQGQAGRDLFLLLDGVLSVVVDGELVAELGPGAILGERAVLEGGIRTATLSAATKVRVAVASPDQVDHEALVQLAVGHRREA
jgi:hypothetical protein